MATPTFRVLAQGIATGSLVAVYTADLATDTKLLALTVANTTGAVIALTVALLSAGGGTPRTIIPPRNIAAGATDFCAEIINHWLAPAGQVLIQGNGLTYYLSGATLVQ